MTLHEAIVEILRNAGRSMSTAEIASEVNSRRSYRKKDGTPVTDFQIHGRTRNYARLFFRKGSQVGLREWESSHKPYGSPAPQDSINKASESASTHSTDDVVGSIDVINRNWLTDRGFAGFFRVADLRLNRAAEAPTSPGVYAVLRESIEPPVFLAESVGGHLRVKIQQFHAQLLSNRGCRKAKSFTLERPGGSIGGHRFSGEFDSIWTSVRESRLVIGVADTYGNLVTFWICFLPGRERLKSNHELWSVI